MPWAAIDVDKAIPWVEQRTKLALADSQKAALRAALVSKVMVITGGPGVGKTTLVNSLLKILAAKAVAIALCAPTGRAAASRRRRSIASSKPIPAPAASGATPTSPWIAICWSSTRPRWSTYR
jgi:exodeoxyribonuclease V alpha subunit